MQPIVISTFEPNVQKAINGKWSILKEDLVIYVAGMKIVVPKGFMSDGASVPAVFRGLLPSDGLYSIPAWVHDWLYSSHEVSKEVADYIFYTLMAYMGVPIWKRQTMYLAVKYGGHKSYAQEGHLKNIKVLKVESTDDNQKSLIKKRILEAEELRQKFSKAA